jgi:hypothetical protein
MDYRRIYEERLGISLPLEFEVHHIDMNRDNNEIENLVALPKHVHQEYHRLIPMIENKQFNFTILGTSDSGNKHNLFFFNNSVEFIKVYEDCSYWIDYRDFLLGTLPNIHKLSY